MEKGILKLRYNIRLTYKEVISLWFWILWKIGISWECDDVKLRVIFSFTFLVITLGLFFMIFFFYYDVQRAVLNNNEELVTFDIKSGSSVSEIAGVLKNKISTISSFTFKLVWYLRGKVPLKAGHYELNGNISLWDLVKVIEEGQLHLKKVLLPEGLTLKETASRLEEAGVIQSQERFLALANDPDFLSSLGLNFATSAEGFLFPDTYFFNEDDSEEEVLTYLVNSFWKTMGELTSQNLDIINSDDFYNIVKLASIVEKEYRDPNEAPLIASVFLNRIQIGMRLESCATLVYVLKEIMGRSHPNRILWKDTEIDSPFNTYRSMGLPPTPIASPGRVALKAVLEPKETSYLFFVVKDSQAGTHTFTKDFADHSQARELYLKNFLVKS